MTREIMADIELTIPCKITVEIDGEERAYSKAGSAEPRYVVEPVARAIGFEPVWPDNVPYTAYTRPIVLWLGEEIEKRRAEIEAQAIEEMRQEARDE